LYKLVNFTLGQIWGKYFLFLSNLSLFIQINTSQDYNKAAGEVAIENINLIDMRDILFKGYIEASQRIEPLQVNYN